MSHPFAGLRAVTALAALAAALAAVLVVPAAHAAAPAATKATTKADYFSNAGRDDVLSGGVKMIPVTTPKGTFKVWTKRTGNNPTIKVLLLHGGPGATHDAFEAFDSYFPGASIEYYYYDQLGAGNSDHADDPEIVNLPRFLDEVEQVRRALKLDKDNFFLLGQSWGGILAMEYALKYPQHLKGVVISNMVASIPAYNEYAHKVLMPKMDQKALAEILALEKAGKFEDPRYEELLTQHFYTDHILRMPPDQWPEPVVRTFAKLNKKIYIPMQGPSEMGASGKLEKWDRFADLKDIRVPTLVIAGQHDTMDPAYMKKMAERIPHARYLLCPNGSHLSMYDDQKTYFDGLIRFLKDVDAKKF